ncbi:MAG: serine/threonine protein phosphatase, partial [Pseudomonadota bacterium]
KAIYVPGNAESIDELRSACADTDATVLHGEAVVVGGVTILGLGYAVPETPFGAWSCDLSEEEATALVASTPKADLFVSHSPPKGVVDRTTAGNSVGSVAVRETIERVQPALCLCGHIHDCWGQEGIIGTTRVRNLGPTVNWFDL